MKFKTAIVRIPGEDFSKGETSSKLGVPDFNLMLTLHREYINVLKQLGLDVIVLDPLSDHPDACFVEDTAVVIPEAGIITNPGAPSRKGEEDGIELILMRYRKTEKIKPPGTLDGGDILQADNHFFIGVSERTNREGADQLSAILHRFGYSSEIIIVDEGLHLKSGVNYLGNGRLLITRDFAGLPQFADHEKIIINEGEEYAANTLLINGTFIMPEGFPGTYKQLADLGRPVITLNMSEARKMDGGLTCLSLRF